MAGIKGKSGGARTNSRIKSKLTDPAVLADWEVHLKRAVLNSTSNMFVLRKESFFTTREIKESFGKKALAEFKTWFSAEKHCDQIQADKLYQERAAGKIDDKKFSKLFVTTAFFWVWTIKPERQVEAWKISRQIN